MPGRQLYCTLVEKAEIENCTEKPAIYILSGRRDGRMSDSIYRKKEKIKIIPNWADVSFLKPCSKADNPFLKEYGLSDKFIVLYSGNLGNTHSVETIVEVAERLRCEQDICFVIIGEGGKKKKIGQMVEEKGLNNCRLLPWQPVERIPYSLGAAMSVSLPWICRLQL